MEDASYEAQEFLSRRGREYWLVGMGAYGEATFLVGSRLRILPGVAINWNPDSMGVSVFQLTLPATGATTSRTASRL